MGELSDTSRAWLVGVCKETRSSLGGKVDAVHGLQSGYAYGLGRTLLIG